MFWADKLLENTKGKQIVNDSSTPSGIVHMGSLKGPVIHDVLSRMLQERKEEVIFMYGFDDMDVIDGLPLVLEESHNQYMGVPLFLAPSPKGDGSFADYYIKKMKVLLEKLEINPKFYRTSELYKDGTFNKAIQHVLDNAQKVRDVYAKIYKKEIAQNWFPLQVICPQCGKLGTTKVVGWNGKEVEYICEPNLVKWAQGCGSTGSMTPFNGNAKMPWKVEWAAKWWVFGVTIEGAGKDHASSGGSYDVAMELITEVFNSKKPLKLAYEFFLSNGKKMSSSKGLGMTGEELLEVMSGDVARFLMVKTPPNQAVEFSPRNSLAVPKVYDDFQKAQNSPSEEQAKAFKYSHLDTFPGIPKARFLQIAQLIQMPNMTDELEKDNTINWAKFAKVWIEKYAPESEKFLVQKTLPDSVKNLNEQQLTYLKKASETITNYNSIEELQIALYELAKSMDIPSKEAFGAIYTVLIGKDHGPKASSLILSLDKDFVINRFKEI